MIRSALASDVELIARLTGQLGYPSSVPEVRSRLATILDREDHALLIADAAEGILGWLHLFGTHLVESAPYVEIGGFVVREGARGRGIGTRLLEAAERWSHARGYGAIRARSNVIRREAHSFYEHRGFRRVKEQAVFVKKLRDRPPG